MFYGSDFGKCYPRVNSAIANYWSGSSLLHRYRPCSGSMGMGFYFFLNPGKEKYMDLYLIFDKSTKGILKLQIQGIKPKIKEVGEKSIIIHWCNSWRGILYHFHSFLTI